MLKIEKMSCGYKTGRSEKTILKNFEMTVGEGEIWCILGRNGAGKTTLFKTILGTLPMLSGTVTLGGADIRQLTKKELAHTIAFVPQYHVPPFPFTVREIVIMGRNAYIGTFGSPSAADIKAAGKVMDDLGIRYLEDKEYTRISGGERQMVLIARAMAQQPKLLMMDEPAANLDYGNQVRMLKQIKTLSEKGISVIFTSHNPEHAFLSSAKVAAIISSEKTVIGEADQIITEDLIHEIYGIRSEIIQTDTAEARRIRSIIPYL